MIGNHFAMNSFLRLTCWVGISLTGGLLSIACATRQAPLVSQEKYPVIHPWRTDTLITKEYVADIQAVQHVEIRARVEGYLDQIHIGEGQWVKKGQLLFSISPLEYRQELLKAKANLKNARAEARATVIEKQNVQKLVEKGVVSDSELERIQSKLEALQARIEEAETAEASAQMRLSLTQVRAPFEGIVDRIPNKTGSLIEEATLLTTLSDNRQVLAYFNVPEREYLDFITSRQADHTEAVTFVMANNQMHPQAGKIEKIDGQIDKSTGNIAFTARFSNRQNVLKHGSSGKIRLIQEIKDALLIPQKATFEVQDKLLVFVLDSQNVVHRRSIVPQRRLPHLYVLESGLSPSERILYEGIQTVKEGDQIDPQLLNLPQFLSPLASH